MKLNCEFEIVTIDDEIMAVPVGDAASDLHAIIRLNETGADILRLLAHETTEDAIVAELCERYEVEEATLRRHVQSFIGKLRESKLLGTSD